MTGYPPMPGDSGIDLSGSVRSSHKTVSHYTLRQWFSNTQQPRFLTAIRRLEKLFLPFIFDTVFHPWWCETSSVIQQQFWKRMWHLGV